MKLFRKLRELGNQGLSMIELLCSLAILSILGMVAGSMLVVSANSYRSENADTGAQKEAQLVANQISDLLIDTTAEVVTSGGVVDGRNRTNLLTIIQGNVGYEVEFVAAEKKLYYSQFTIDASGNKINYTSKQLMAENLVNFYADVTTFKETGNVKLDMVYAKGDGEYPAVFTVTARNKELMAGTAPEVFVSVPAEIILEPNQSHTIPVAVSGAASNVKFSIDGSVAVGTTVNADTGEVKISSTELVNMFRVKVATTATKPDGTPLVTKFVRVYVRKVTDVDALGSLVSGMPYKSGAVYTVNSTITGNNLEQAIGQAWDNDYIDARTVGAKYTVSCSGISFSDFTFTNSPSGGLNIVLNTDMPDGASITVTATAKHPLGTDGTNNFNKTGSPYYPTVTDTWILRKPASVLTPGGGWMRRSNEAQADVNGSVLASVKPAGTRHAFQFMYREYPGGTFQSDWLNNVYGGDADDSMAVNLRPLFTGVLDYDKDYEIKIRLICKDSSGNIVWPTASTPEEEYLIQSIMRRVSITFDSTKMGLTDAKQNDEASAPTLNIRKDEQIGADGSLLKYNKVIGIDVNGTDFENRITYILEKKDASGNWVAASGVEVQNPNRWLQMTFRSTGFSGSYRVKIIVKDQKKYGLDASNNLIEVGNEDYILYDE
ncbi:MAG: prepilin-type N-terminal cleavage/methylation domain-containing protein, partial [Candidatus Cryptobacteroides sp.]